MNCVSPFELAVLVRGYLQQNGYSKTAASFQREAKAHFRGAGSGPPPGVRDLLELLNDYVRLKERETRRLALAGRNPLAARMLEALEAEAGEQQAAVTAAATAEAVARQAAVAAQQAQAQWLQAAPAAGASAAPPSQALLPQFVPGQAASQPYAGGQQVAGAAASPSQAATPGRQRKGAPRKRRLSLGSPQQEGGGQEKAAGGPLGGGGDGGWGSPLDFLNLQFDAEGLEVLLDDGPLQLQFAEHLAQHINDSLGGAAAAAAGGGRLGSGLGGGEAGSLTGLLAAPQRALAELPGDPRMAEVLQAVVRPQAASPTPPARAAPAAAEAAAAAGGQRRRQRTVRPPSRTGGSQQPVLPVVSGAEPSQQQQAAEQQPQPDTQQQQPAAAGTAVDHELGLQAAAEQAPGNGTNAAGQMASPRPRSQQMLLGAAPVPKVRAGLQDSALAATGQAPQAGAAAVDDSAAEAALRLNRGLLELGILELPASEDQLLQDIDDMF